jgi:hypothetical protein
MNAFPSAQGLPHWAGSPALAWIGELDRVDADGVIEGWCWCPDTPDARATIVIKLDGVPVDSARCDTMRPDLAANGMGDGAYGFVVILPDDIVSAGRDGIVSLHDCDRGRLLGTPRHLHGRAQDGKMLRPVREDRSATPSVIEGNLDGVSADGVVGGWCWNPLQPDRRINVTVAIDGQVVGTTRAANVRPDLKKAGIGDGAHGFTFVLGASLLEITGQISVSVADADTGQAFGVPCVARLGQLAATQDRLADIEHAIRRLGADFAAFTAQEALREECSPTADLLATLGSLFQDLAQGRKRPRPGDAFHMPLSLTGRSPSEDEFALAVPSHPKATVIVPVGNDIAELRACLYHLHLQGIDRQAGIILFDSGASSDPASLNATIRNLRVAVDTGADLPSWIARLSQPDVPIVFLAPLLRPDALWLDHLLAAHTANPNAAVIGGLVAGLQDGLLRSAGIDADQNDIPLESGQLERSDTQAYRCLRKIEAVSALGFLLSPHAIARTACRGPNAEAQGLAEAVFDLCLQYRLSGLDILALPAAVAHCADAADVDPYTPDFSRCEATLQDTWRTRPRLIPPIGRILIIDDHFPTRLVEADPGPDIVFLLMLHAAEYRVTVAATSGPVPEGDAEWLESNGIAVFRPLAAGSISAMLLAQGDQFDMIAFTARQPPAVLIERARLLAPHALLIQTCPPPAVMPRCRSEISVDAPFWLCHDRAFRENGITPPC